MNHQPAHTSEAGSPASEAKRFTYASGSKPLDGFTIKRGVGHGGFGEVYYATSDAGKEVALKLVRRSLDVELRGIRQCLNLKHPNLLGVFDIKEDSRGEHWVIMEYVAGDCLDEVIARHPNGMPADEALAWLSGIAAGVGYLHDHGIVHRDLKPGNIFSEDGHVTVGDYGLTKFISCSRRSGHTESVGTVHYMAPEVANGRYGKEIDIYAMGIMLYEMLTGRLPFEGESVGEVLMKHLTAKPDVSMLEEPYRSVIARALEKDPEKRYSTVDEMLAGLPVDGRGAAQVNQLPHARVTQAAGAAGSNGNGYGAGKAMNGPPAPPRATAQAEPADDEPILRAVRQCCSNFGNWWNGLNSGAQVAVILVIALIVTTTPVIALAIPLLILYGIYRIIRAIVLPSTPKGGTGGAPVPSRNTGAPPVAPGGQGSPQTRKHYRRPRPYEKPVPALIVKPLGERIADLLGSMLFGTLVAVIMTLVMSAVASLDRPAPIEFVAYVMLVSIAATWAVLVPAKFWEGTQGDTTLRRFVMMTVGLVVGLFAWGCLEWLTVEMMFVSDSLQHYVAPYGGDLRDLFGASRNMPSLLAHTITFGVLFLLVRWWRQADPLRPVRLSLWVVFLSVLAAMLIAVFLHGLGWTLVLIALIMSVSVQIASPWINPRLRPMNVEE